MLRRVFWGIAILVGIMGLAHAQSSLGIGTNEVSQIPAAGGLFAWIYVQQQTFFRALQSALTLIRDGGNGGTMNLIGLSFAYGIFHAAGPGHGKAVISSYMFANEVALKRGIALSFASSLAQAISAILLVGAGFLVLRGAALTMTNATWFLEMTSYAMIAALGGLMLWRKLQSSLNAKSHDHQHHEHSHHNHSHHNRAHNDHGHLKGDMVCDTCGHSHAPDPSQLTASTLSLRETWGLIIAVGLRPCTGAIVVLSFALLNGLYLTGLLSVIVMALGTAITVSVLAAMAVYAKDIAKRFSGERSNVVGHAIENIGASLVMVLGLGLLYAGYSA